MFHTVRFIFLLESAGAFICVHVCVFCIHGQSFSMGFLGGSFIHVTWIWASLGGWVWDRQGNEIINVVWGCSGSYLKVTLVLIFLLQQYAQCNCTGQRMGVGLGLGFRGSWSNHLSSYRKNDPLWSQCFFNTHWRFNSATWMRSEDETRTTPAMAINHMACQKGPGN